VGGYFCVPVATNVASKEILMDTAVIEQFVGIPSYNLPLGYCINTNSNIYSFKKQHVTSESRSIKKLTIK